MFNFLIATYDSIGSYAFFFLIYILSAALMLIPIAFLLRKASLFECLALTFVLWFISGYPFAKTVAENTLIVHQAVNYEIGSENTPIQKEILKAIKDGESNKAVRLSKGVAVDKLIYRFGDYPEIIALQQRLFLGESIEERDVFLASPVSTATISKLKSVVAATNNKKLLASFEKLTSSKYVLIKDYIWFFNEVDLSVRYENPELIEMIKEARALYTSNSKDILM